MRQITNILFSIIFFLLSAGMVNAQNTINAGDSLRLQVDGTYRGELLWQFSTDSVNWETLNGSYGSDFSFLPVESGYIRSIILEENCDTLVSDVQKIVMEGMAQHEAFVVTDPNNPLVLSVLRTDDIKVNYYADKQEDGKVNYINMVTVQHSDSLNSDIIELDSLGRPDRAFGADGSLMDFEWINEQEFRILYTTANGEITVNVPFDFSEETQMPVPAKPKEIFRSRELEVMVTQKVPDSEVPDLPGQLGNFWNYNVQLTRCGEPYDDAYVHTALTGIGGDKAFQSESKASSSGGGNYNLKIRPFVKGPNLTEPVCETVVVALDHTCDWGSLYFETPGSSGNDALICARLALYLDLATPVVPGDGLVYFAGCEALINSIRIYCQTLGESGVPMGQSVLARLCKLNEPVPPSQYTLRTLIWVKGKGKIEGPTRTVNPGDSFIPSMTLDLPSETKIQDIITNPWDPAPGQDYIATADIYCAEEGMEATISVKGTDDYSKSKTVTLPAGNSTISISVPGAEAGVYDALKVTIPGVGTSYAAVVF